MRLKLLRCRWISFPGSSYKSLNSPPSLRWTPSSTTRTILPAHALPTVIGQMIEVMRQGQEDKLMPPKYLLAKVIVQCRSIGEPAGAENAFAQPIAKFPDAIPAPDQKRIRGAVLESVENKVRPSYLGLASFVETTYAPGGRTNEGMWSLPNGDALYRYAIRTQTTTQKSADEIHQLGLQQVAEIEEAQTAIALRLGAKDLKSFRESINTNPKAFPKSREEMLNLYRKYIAQMEPQLPKLFGLLPKARLEVVPVEQFREKDASAAQYNAGTPDGSRPGKVYVNTGDYQHRSTLESKRLPTTRAYRDTYADLDCAGITYTATVSPARRVWGIQRRLGTVRGAIGEGSWFLSRSLF